ncbi:MAG TPA: hypothetical protein EYH38_08825, partial [Leucothrix sp.]|nr:hypothetical protein [Leucothrix sp.]
MKTWLLLICLTVISPALILMQQANATTNTPDISAFQPIIKDLQQRFPKSPQNPLIVISASEQRLFLIKDNKVVASHIISTAEAGLGNRKG